MAETKSQMSFNPRLYYILIYLLVHDTLNAQQLPLFTQYREFQSIINPAAVSHDYLFWEGYTTSFGISYRNQWDKIKGGPTTATLRGEHIFDLGNAVSPIVGGHIMKDQAGPISYTGAYGRFAMLLSDDPYYHGFSLGLSAGLVQYGVETQELIAIYPDDILTFDDQTKIFPDIGIGIYGYKRIEDGFLEGDNIYAGFSIPQVFGLNLLFKDATGAFSIRRTPHYFGVIGVNKYINSKSYLELAGWVKYVKGAPINVDVNLRYLIHATIWLGGGISSAGLGHFETGIMFGENIGWDHVVRIGFGYDPAFNTYGVAFGNVYEINMSIILDSNY